MKLKEGVYENLISSRLTADMKETEAEGGVCKTEPIDAAESAKLLADFLLTRYVVSWKILMLALKKR